MKTSDKIAELVSRMQPSTDNIIIFQELKKDFSGAQYLIRLRYNMLLRGEDGLINQYYLTEDILRETLNYIITEVGINKIDYNKIIKPLESRKRKAAKQAIADASDPLQFKHKGFLRHAIVCINDYLESLNNTYDSIKSIYKYHKLYKKTIRLEDELLYKDLMSNIKRVECPDCGVKSLKANRVKIDGKFFRLCNCGYDLGYKLSQRSLLIKEVKKNFSLFNQGRVLSASDDLYLLKEYKKVLLESLKYY